VNLIWQILYYSAFIAPLIGAIIGAIYYKKLKTEDRILAGFLLASFLTQVLQMYFGFIKDVPNLFLIPLYGFFEFLLFSIIYARFFSGETKKVLNFIIPIIGIGLMTEVAISFFNQNPTKFISYGKIFVNLSIIGYSSTYLIKVLLDKKQKLIPNRINLSFILLINYTLTLLLFLAVNFLINNSLKIVSYFWMFHALITALYYGILTYYIWNRGKTLKYLH
jgi:hypothetical protein